MRQPKPFPGRLSGESEAEIEVSHLHAKVDQLHAVLLSRLHHIETRLRG